MPRKALDQELGDLHKQILRLGSLVDDMLSKALQFLEANGQSGMQIDTEDEISRLSTAIEKQAIRLLILQQPLGGRDLRFLTAASQIAGKLEQAGSEANEIADTIRQLSPLQENASTAFLVMQGTTIANDADLTDEPVQISEHVILRGLLDLGAAARRMLQGSLQAFDCYDSNVARAVVEERKYIDIRYERVRRDVMSMLARTYATISALESGLYMLQNAIHLFWIAQKLKLYAVYAEKICLRIIFILFAYYLYCGG